ncbi:unnamed protein product [Mytilus coruscus]|uniref:Novel STAND NTPase 3 domain-containing protein n=1 Tax=Mytilus coruscus TaxID=42192 RepID=A0A6J8DAL2_MYTCO|nr:unnamed protein product [Mytilus coruscus]
MHYVNDQNVLHLFSVILFALPVLQDCFYRIKRKRTDFETIPLQDVEEKIASLIANEKSSLEKQIEANDVNKISKLEENVPHHVLELQKEILQHWSNVLNKFVLTKAAQFLYRRIQTENVIAIIGPTGTGKSAYAYHIAFRLKNEYGYTIMPARQSSDIIQYYLPAVLAIKQQIAKKSCFDDIENEELINNLFGESGFQIRPSKKLIISSLEAMTDTYVKANNDFFEFIHQTMQNIVLYCISKTLINSVFKFSKTDVIKNQVRLACIREEQTVPVIEVTSEHEDAYFTRLMQDLSKGLYVDVFENNQNAFETFRHKLCTYINKHKQEIHLKTNSNGLTVLHVVSLFGYDDLVSLFINNDKRMIHMSDGNGNTPLHLAAYNGYPNIVKLLVEAGRNVHLLNNEQLSPFFFACENNSIPVVNYLINLKDDFVKINETYMLREYKSVLHIACLKGFERLIKILLDHHASIDIQDTSGFTPLHSACINGQIDTALLLLKLKAGANTNAVDTLEQTPVFYACTGNYKNIVELLIGYKADINQITSTGLLRIPLHAACEKGNIEIVNILIKNLSNINVKEQTVESPLHISCRQGNERIVNLLIDHSASVNSKTMDKLTPLHVACNNGHLNVADILLKKKANYKPKNIKGWTALFFQL